MPAGIVGVEGGLVVDEAIAEVMDMRSELPDVAMATALSTALGAVWMLLPPEMEDKDASVEAVFHGRFQDLGDLGQERFSPVLVEIGLGH